MADSIKIGKVNVKGDVFVLTVTEIGTEVSVSEKPCQSLGEATDYMSKNKIIDSSDIVVVVKKGKVRVPSEEFEKEFDDECEKGKFLKALQDAGVYHGDIFHK